MFAKALVKRCVFSCLLAIPPVKRRIAHYRRIAQELDQLRDACGFDPGHYYSPIPNVTEVEKEASAIFGKKDLADIDLNTENQLTLLEELKKYYPSYPYVLNNIDTQHLRYKQEGAFYRYSDCVFLYCMMRHFKPKAIIEIGSGHSSAVMMDTNESHFNNQTSLTFIEPYPENRLIPILREHDKCRVKIIEAKVQSVKLELFQMLGEGDMLFIDSTHVSKVGSDVNYIMFEVLPMLKPGVLIHFHDIFYPFELPKEWIVKHRWFWNENYVLHAFLMNNTAYDIIAFNSYLQQIRIGWFKKEMPECLVGSDDTGSIWIRKS